jgi:hypothetical protein
MPPVDRRNPIRAASSESTCNVLEFFREFPDDEACLQHIWRERFAPDGEHDGAQPYKTGDSSHPLWLLQALWNTDKHRTLHTSGFAYILAANQSDDPGLEYGYNGWHWGPFGDRFDSENRTQLGGGRTFRDAIPTDNPLKQVMDAYEGVAFDVILGHTGPLPDWDTEPYGGLPIRQVLRRLQRFVTEDVVKPLS